MEQLTGPPPPTFSIDQPVLPLIVSRTTKDLGTKTKRRQRLIGGKKTHELSPLQQPATDGPLAAIRQLCRLPCKRESLVDLVCTLALPPARCRRYPDTFRMGRLADANALGANNPHDLGHSKTRCPLCHHPEVSLVRVDNRLPSEIRPFFTPFPSQVEQLFAAAQFQYCGMTEKIQYQQELVEKLVNKVNKQKELLLIAKEKVSQISELENTVKRLQGRLQSQLPHHHRQLPTPLPPATVDLTMDAVEALPLADHRDMVSRSFIDQVKQSSSQKGAALNKYRYTDPNQSMEVARGRLAESTKIHQESPIRSNVPIGSKFKHVLPASSTPSSYRCSMSSNGSGTNSVTSRSEHLLTSMKPQATRITKNRAATSQLAQKLTAHMKIGSLNRSSSSMGIRPASSFTNPNLFKKR